MTDEDWLLYGFGQEGILSKGAVRSWIIGQEGIVSTNLFKGAIAHQVLYHRSKGIIYNLGWTDGWVWYCWVSLIINPICSDEDCLGLICG